MTVQELFYLLGTLTMATTLLVLIGLLIGGYMAWRKLQQTKTIVAASLATSLASVIPRATVIPILLGLFKFLRRKK